MTPAMLQVQSCSLLVLFPLIFALQCPDGWHSSASDNNKCIRIFASAYARWYEAERYCQQNATAGNTGHLVSVHSAFENNNIQGTVTIGFQVHYALAAAAPSSSACEFWMGAIEIGKTGVFQWTDATNYLYSNWLPGRPDDDENRNNQCAFMNAKSTNQWDTGECIHDHKCFICEMYPTPSSTPAPLLPTLPTTYCTSHSQSPIDLLSQSKSKVRAERKNIPVCPVESSPPIDHPSTASNSSSFAAAIAIDPSSDAIILTWFDNSYSSFSFPYVNIYLSWLNKDNVWVLKNLNTQRGDQHNNCRKGSMQTIRCAVVGLPPACTKLSDQDLPCNKAFYTITDLFCACNNNDKQAQTIAVFFTGIFGVLGFATGAGYENILSIGQASSPNYPYFNYLTKRINKDQTTYFLFTFGNDSTLGEDNKFSFDNMTLCYNGNDGFLCDILASATSPYTYLSTVRVGALVHVKARNEYHFCQFHFTAKNDPADSINDQWPPPPYSPAVFDWCTDAINMNTSENRVSITMTNGKWYMADTNAEMGSKFVIHSIDSDANVVSSLPNSFIGNVADPEFSNFVGQVIRDRFLYIGLQSAGPNVKHVIVKFGFDLQ